MNNRIYWGIGLIAALLITGGTGWVLTRPASADRNTAELASYLSSEGDGFTQATEPGQVEFPRDFGPHEDYQTEWWYYTGNLETDDGREFGYQFTIFRRAITPPDQMTESESAWRTGQFYFAHFTISDIESGAFYNFEKFSRGNPALAGATAAPYHVWIEDWSVEEMSDGTHQIYATTENVSMTLDLTQTQPPVLHGKGGLSQKGDDVGNASYYYSLVNQASVGSIEINGERFDVTGHSWKDHEYSTSALDDGAVGWDWFSLVFDDDPHHSLMLFEIRREDGSTENESSGSWIAADSSTLDLEADDFEVDVLDYWVSEETGVRYPAEWEIRIPSIGLEMSGRPLMPNQELNDISTLYWEGAVRFTGTLAGEPIEATGYVEMTGY